MTRLPLTRARAGAVLTRAVAAVAAVAVAVGFAAWPAGARADAASPVLTVTLGGDGSGTVTANAVGIACATGTCTATFAPGTPVTLTATPAAGSAFTGFGNACTGQTCTLVMSGDATVTADFDAAPTITAPANGAAYPQAAVPAAAFACAPGDTACTATLADGTPVANGGALPAAPGSYSLTVTAVAADGSSVTQSVAYTVVAPPVPAGAGQAPEVAISAPVDNAAYLWTAIPAADFTCAPGPGSTVQSCQATVGGQPIADHEALPDGFGAHVLTVTATDADGLSSTATATYTATVATASLPPVTIQAPAQDGRYRLDETVAARYSCLATATGAALRSCVGTVPAGHRIDTARLGAHAFTVSATSDRGESTTETVTYAVVPTTNRFSIVRLDATASGAARVALRLPGPGSVRVRATGWDAAAGASAHHIPYGTVSVGARQGGRLALIVTPSSSAARALLSTRGARPVIALAVTYTPTGARPRIVRLRPLPVRRSSRPTARR